MYSTKIDAYIRGQCSWWWLIDRWSESNREQLQQHNSSLEFKLHRLRFIEYVERGVCAQSDAVQYAKNFAPFAAAHSKGLFSLKS